MKNILRNKAFILLFALFLTIIVFIFSLFLGSAALSFNEVLSGLFDIGGASTYSLIVRTVRLPRTLGALFAGLALSLSGFLLQSATDNDLCAPNIVGINSGAGFGVMLVSSLLPSLFYFESLFAFVFALFAAGLTLAISSSPSRQFSRVTILLGGVAISALFGSGISFLSLRYPDALVSYTAFSVGGLSGVYLDDILLPSVLITVCTLISLLLSQRLNYLPLGDEIAASLGIRVNRLRILSVVLAAALSASAVSFVGLIGFVGLIVPHLARRLVGSDARFAMPLSCLLGSVLVMLADIFSRILFAPGEVPLGIFTSLIGAPFFIYLLVINARKEGHYD